MRRTPKMTPSQLWLFLPLGYLVTVLIETPVLLVGLSSRHSIKRKLFAGMWLTACTYPIVALVLPLVLAKASRITYLVVAETFAPVAECVLFWLAFGVEVELGRRSMWRDFSAILLANLSSFVVGETLSAHDWFGLIR